MPTAGHSIRHDNDEWDAAIAKARRAGTTLNTILSGCVRKFLEEQEVTPEEIKAAVLHGIKTDRTPEEVDDRMCAVPISDFAKAERELLDAGLIYRDEWNGELTAR